MAPSLGQVKVIWASRLLIMLLRLSEMHPIIRDLNQEDKVNQIFFCKNLIIKKHLKLF